MVATYAQSAEESKATLAQRPDLDDPHASDPRVVEVAARNESEVVEIRALLEEAMPRIRQARETYRDVIARMLPSDDAVLGRAAVVQAQRNASVQAQIASEFGFLTATQVADQAASAATNRSATAARWRTANRISAVSWKGTSVYPGFQFAEDGQPLPLLSEILPTLKRFLSGWEIAAWLTAPRAELAGRRVVDVWLNEPELVNRLVGALVAERNPQNP